MPMTPLDYGDPFVGDRSAGAPSEPWRPEFLISEAQGRRSRGTAPVVTEAVFPEGTVLQLDGDGVTYVPLVNAANASAIALYPSDSEATAIATIMRDAEVSVSKLIWPTGFTRTQKATATVALEALDIIARP